MPAPVWKWMVSFWRTAVRMAMLHRLSPLKPNPPMAPVYRPRGWGSSSAMISVARFLGAPVMEPPGKQARKAWAWLVELGSRPSTVETR